MFQGAFQRGWSETFSQTVPACSSSERKMQLNQFYNQLSRGNLFQFVPWCSSRKRCLRSSFTVTSNGKLEHLDHANTRTTGLLVVFFATFEVFFLQIFLFPNTRTTESSLGEATRQVMRG